MIKQALQENKIEIEYVNTKQMIADGCTLFTEVGPGNVLQGLVKKIDREAQTASATFEI